ncbi:MAG: hypothetical protein BroJett040_00200 [Oligoflexia bacterium]|nr:MAG: hypothetical protein BroJett040_00200 [Oligoflexia bacterium]
MTKSQWRKAMRGRLAEWVNQHHQLENKSLHQNLCDFLQTKTGVWGAFRAHGLEPNLQSATQLNLHIIWAYPKMMGEELLWIQPGPKGFTRGPFGIEEPALEGGRVCELKSISGILVPGLAFDAKGGRLGQGRGFFDKALVDFQGLKVGIAWEVQMIDQVPCETHDIRMDYVITNKQAIQC